MYAWVLFKLLIYNIVNCVQELGNLFLIIWAYTFGACFLYSHFVQGLGMLVFSNADWRFLRLWHFIVGCYFNGYICIFVTFSSGRIMFYVVF
jgi:hypothetical protein